MIVTGTVTNPTNFKIKGPYTRVSGQHATLCAGLGMRLLCFAGNTPNFNPVENDC